MKEAARPMWRSGSEHSSHGEDVVVNTMVAQNFIFVPYQLKYIIYMDSFGSM